MVEFVIPAEYSDLKTKTLSKRELSLSLGQSPLLAWPKTLTDFIQSIHTSKNNLTDLKTQTS